jgi:release factor glutamine methyltransferase
MRVAAEAPRWLAIGGHLLVETSEGQAPAMVDAIVHSGLIAEVARSEELNSTVVIGTQPGPFHE